MPIGILDGLDVALECDTHCVVADQLGTEALSLGAHRGHQVRSHDSVREAWVVLDFGGVHQGSTSIDRAFEHQWVQSVTGAVDRRGVARRPAADDDDVANLRLLAPVRRYRGVRVVNPDTGGQPADRKRVGRHLDRPLSDQVATGSTVAITSAPTRWLTWLFQHLGSQPSRVDRSLDLYRTDDR